MNRLADITTGIYVGTSYQYTTTSTVVSDGDGGCLVIDPAVTVADLAELAADLRALSLTPRVGFATHPHWDHVLWSAGFGGVPRYASAAAVATAERERQGLIAGAERAAPGHDLELFGRLTPLAAGADAVPWGGPTAHVVTHRAHAPGHSAVFFPGSGTLVAGDMCSDIEIPLLDLDQADPGGDYMAALDLLGALPVDRVIPGHGHVGDAAEFRRRIEADVRYVDDLRAGRDSCDPRLATDWLAAEHQRHVAAIRSGPRLAP
jgi:hydroxyacylglutathione hydrolase